MTPRARGGIVGVILTAVIAAVAGGDPGDPKWIPQTRCDGDVVEARLSWPYVHAEAERLLVRASLAFDGARLGQPVLFRFVWSDGRALTASREAGEAEGDDVAEPAGRIGATPGIEPGAKWTIR